MKANQIATATVATLRETAKAENVTLPAKAKKPEIVEILTLHFAPKDDAKGEAVENSKAAKKKELPHRARMTKVYDTFRVLIDDKAEPDENGRVKVESVAGIVAEFWKADKKAADFGGVTLRFDDKAKAFGADRAILSNVRKACKDAGLVINPIVLRKGGSGSMCF